MLVVEYTRFEGDALHKVIFEDADSFTVEDGELWITQSGSEKNKLLGCFAFDRWASCIDPRAGKKR